LIASICSKYVANPSVEKKKKIFPPIACETNGNKAIYKSYHFLLFASRYSKTKATQDAVIVYDIKKKRKQDGEQNCTLTKTKHLVTSL
jgi:hypothetical protein